MTVENIPPMTAAVLITIFTVLLIMYLERLKAAWIKKIFNWLPAILLAYLIPAICSLLLNRDFSEVQIHEWSKVLFIPLYFAKAKPIGEMSEIT